MILVAPIRRRSCYCLVSVIGIEAEPVDVSIVSTIVPVMELPLRVPAKFPVTFDPLGVTNVVTQLMFRTVPDIW